MKKPLTVFLLFGLLLSMAATVTIHGEEIDVHNVDQELIDEAVQTYNEEYKDDVPGLVRSLVKDEKVNVNISTDSEPAVYGAAMDGMKIDRVETDGLDNPTLTIYTSTDTLKEIAEAEKPRKRAVKALRQGDIRHEARGFFRSIKFGVVSTLIKVFG